MQSPSEENGAKKETDKGPPTGLKLALLMVSLLLTVFLVSLVCLVNLAPARIMTADSHYLGPPYHRNCHSTDYQRVSIYRRYWMVRSSVPIDQLRIPAPSRKALHRVSHQIHISGMLLRLRARLRNMRRGSKLNRIHSRQGDCRSWIRWCPFRLCKCKQTVPFITSGRRLRSK